MSIRVLEKIIVLNVKILIFIIFFLSSFMFEIYGIFGGD